MNWSELGVLAPVTEPTEWVSQMAVARKKNGNLRLCIDPKSLNSVLLREHYQLPTLDDTLAKFNKCTVFSKLDVRSAYWHLQLDDESSKLTTMITPFGRFRWLRLPFGLCVSSEIFQRNLMNILSDLEGIVCVADDISVMGTSEADHDAKLEALLNRCDSVGIKLNHTPDKLQIGLSSISLHGHVFSKEGIHPDPAKLEAISRMPAPTDVHGVRRFCGMVQYLAKILT